jgi:hypothetical protein
VRDQIPYLLDLADGVTRMINEETRSRRMPAFGMRPPNTSKCEIVIFKEIGRLKTSVDTLPMSGVKGLPWSIDFGSLKIVSDPRFRNGAHSHEAAAKESTYA